MTALEDLTAGASVRGLLASGVTPVESVQSISQQAVKAIYATAKNAKIRLRPMISVGRAEPVAVAKRGPTVGVVMAVEEYQRLKEVEARMKTDQSDQATGRHD